MATLVHSHGGARTSFVDKDGGPQPWTTQPPTEAGSYWAVDVNAPEPRVVHVWYFAAEHELPGGWVIRDPFYDRDRSPDDYTYWLGPLPQPAPPSTDA